MSAPTRIGPYDVVGRLGKGGMGTVYEVRHPELPRRLALKLLLRLTEHTVARFEREGQLLARIQHPGVVPVHELGRDPQRGHYLVTGLVEGNELTALCDGEGLDPSRAARLARALAEALGAIHAHGVLHRDLKPANVIVRADDAPVLIDFGLAWTGDGERLTQTGHMVGTPAYMAPEQAAGKSAALDARTDVYGLGAVLFHMLTGQPPFEGDSLLEVLSRVSTQPVRWPQGATIPRALRSICEKALAKSPGERYPTAAALGADVQRFLDGASVEARPVLRLPARLGPALALAALVLLGGPLLLLALTSTPGPTPPPPTGEDDPATEPARQRQRAARADAEATRIAGLAAERNVLPHLRAARAWLDAHPAHPRRAEVQTGYDLAAQRLPLPLAKIPLAPGQSNPLRNDVTLGVFWGEDRVLTASLTRPLRLWDVSDPESPRPLSVWKPVSRFQTSTFAALALATQGTPEAGRCLVAYQEPFRQSAVHSLEGGELKRLEIEFPRTGTSRDSKQGFGTRPALAFAPDGRHFLLSSGTFGKGPTQCWLRVLPIEGGHPICTFGPFPGRILDVTVSPKGWLALSSGQAADLETRSNAVHIFADWRDERSAHHTIQFAALPRALAVTHDDGLLVTVNRHKAFLAQAPWSATERDLSYLVGQDALAVEGTPVSHSGSVLDVVTYAGGHLVITASGGTTRGLSERAKNEIRLWDLSRGARQDHEIRGAEVLRRLNLPSPCTGLELSPNEQLLLVLHGDERPELWALTPP